MHVVGISTLAGAHLRLVPDFIEQLGALGRADILTVVGGVIPKQDIAELRSAGVAAVFPSGTVLVEAVAELLALLSRRHYPSA